MKNRKNSPISFGITLVSTDRTDGATSDFRKSVPPVHHENIMPGKSLQRPSAYVIGSTCRKTPAAARPPFSKEIFKYKSVPQPKLPPKPMLWEQQRIHAEPESLRSRPSYSSDASVVWEIVKFAGTGIFLVLKYTAIAICLVITVGCFMCAGRK